MNLPTFMLRIAFEIPILSEVINISPLSQYMLRYFQPVSTVFYCVVLILVCRSSMAQEKSVFLNLTIRD